MSLCCGWVVSCGLLFFFYLGCHMNTDGANTFYGIKTVKCDISSASVFILPKRSVYLFIYLFIYLYILLMLSDCSTLVASWRCSVSLTQLLSVSGLITFSPITTTTHRHFYFYGSAWFGPEEGHFGRSIKWSLDLREIAAKSLFLPKSHSHVFKKDQIVYYTPACNRLNKKGEICC